MGRDDGCYYLKITKEKRRVTLAISDDSLERQYELIPPFRCYPQDFFFIDSIWCAAEIFGPRVLLPPINHPHVSRGTARWTTELNYPVRKSEGLRSNELHLIVLVQRRIRISVDLKEAGGPTVRDLRVDLANGVKILHIRRQLLPRSQFT